MDQNKTALERAFQLAESGQVEDIADIRIRLRAEGYDLGQLVGGALIKQLSQIIEKARINAHRT